MKEFTDAEKKEIARLENELLCSEMADCPMWGYEAPYREKLRARLRELRGY